MSDLGTSKSSSVSESSGGGSFSGSCAGDCTFCICGTSQTTYTMTVSGAVDMGQYKHYNLINGTYTVTIYGGDPGYCTWYIHYDGTPPPGSPGGGFLISASGDGTINVSGGISIATGDPETSAACYWLWISDANNNLGEKINCSSFTLAPSQPGMGTCTIT